MRGAYCESHALQPTWQMSELHLQMVMPHCPKMTDSFGVRFFQNKAGQKKNKHTSFQTNVLYRVRERK